MKTKLFLCVMLLLCGLAKSQESLNDTKEASIQKPKTMGESPYSVDIPQVVWIAREKLSMRSRFTDIAIDVEENVYITGAKMYGRGLYFDALTIKYNSVGIKRWQRLYEGEDSDVDNTFAAKLIVDLDNNIYVTGVFSYGFHPAYMACKYDLFGKLLWMRRYNGENKSYHYMTDFVVDNFGNVYVTGASIGKFGAMESATVKYDKAGKQCWTARHHGDSRNYGSNAFAIALDGSGNIYVTGNSADLWSNVDYTTIKYNPEGIMQWVVRYGRVRDSFDQASALAVDAAGNVYVAGFNLYSRKDGQRKLATIVKYTTAGKQLWAVSFPIQGGLIPDRFSFKVWVDAAENVYLTGVGMSVKKDIVIKYNKDGALQWEVNYQEENGGIARINDIALDRAGNIYVTGTSTKSAIIPNWDYMTIRYNPDGRREWLHCYNGPQNTHDYANALVVDGSGNVYVTGMSYGLKQAESVTIKYSQNFSSSSASTNKQADIEKRSIVSAINLPDKTHLAPNYPNPFNPSTTIRFGLPQASHMTLKVYNVLSAEVATLLDGPKPAGVHAVDFTPKSDLPSGIYFAVLTAGEVRLVQRMVYAK